MAPKRHRGESSQSSSFDKKRFVNQEASDHYFNIIDKKKLISERGLSPGGKEAKLVDMITDQQWYIRLTHQPAPAIISLVKEFYANAKDVQHNEVWVRGKLVSFSAETINHYYRLQAPDINEYQMYKQELVDSQEIIDTLCQPESTWKMTDGEPVHFSYKRLSRYGKAWYYFICAKLLPTTHVTEVTKDRAILLYCIVKEMKMNIGQIINGSIWYAINGGPSRGLPHPSLICALCSEAGVEWAADEPVQQPQVVIDARIIRNFREWDGAEPNPSGAGFILEPQSPDTEELFAATPPPEDPAMQQGESSSHVPMQFLVDEVHQLRRESRRQTRRIDSMAQNMQSMMEFNAQFSTTLANIFTNMGVQAGGAPVQFPVAPTWLPGPPDSPDAPDDTLDS